MGIVLVGFIEIYSGVSTTPNGCPPFATAPFDPIVALANIYSYSKFNSANASMSFWVLADVGRPQTFIDNTFSFFTSLTPIQLKPPFYGRLFYFIIGCGGRI